MKNIERLAIESVIYDNVPLDKGRDDMLVALRRDSEVLAALTTHSKELTQKAQDVLDAIYIIELKKYPRLKATIENLQDALA